MAPEESGGLGPDRIVVGYDGSADGDRGLQWAIDYAKLRDLPLEVFSTSGDLEYLHERTAHNIAELVGGWERQARALLEQSGLSRWTTTTSEGKIVPELIEASSSASMVVVGARGHGRLGGMLLGSVSQHLARHAHCPVVVARGPRSSRSNRVVVGVDGSEAAMQALRFGFDHAARTGGCVVAVHGRAVSAMNGPFDVAVSPAVNEEMEEADRDLAQWVAPVREEHPDIQVDLVALPMPAVRALADATANASLLVVGTRGLGGFMGLLLGSVSATVLQHAECPVVVVR